MLESPACRGRDKHAEDRATAPKTCRGQEEGQGPVPRQNEEEIKVTKKLAKKELPEDQIKEQEQFPGVESCQVSCGEIGQGAQEKIGGAVAQPPPRVLYSQNCRNQKINSKILINTVLIEHLEAREARTVGNDAEEVIA